MNPQQQGHTPELEEIIELRSKLPKNWTWQKCYGLSYTDGSVREHWALKAIDSPDKVASLGLISQDCYSTPVEFKKEVEVQFVEKSLSITDALLSENASLRSHLSEALKVLGELVKKVEVLRSHLVEEVHPDNRSAFNDMVTDLYNENANAVLFILKQIK